jgi:hypothetical protein
MQAGGDDGQDAGPENESARRNEGGTGDRKGVLTPVYSHPQDDEWRRIGLGLRVLLAGAVAEPLPAEMERALNRLAEAEQCGPKPDQRRR